MYLCSSFPSLSTFVASEKWERFPTLSVAGKVGQGMVNNSCLSFQEDNNNETLSIGYGYIYDMCIAVAFFSLSVLGRYYRIS